MIKTLYNQIGQYKLASVLTPVFTALEVVVDVLIPYVTAKLIDDGLNAGNMQAVYLYGGLMVLMAMVSLAFGILAGRYSAYASTGFGANLRSAMYKNIQRFAFSDIDKFSTSGLVTRMTTDVQNLQQAFQQILRITVRAPFRLILSIVMCLVIDPRLSLIFIVAMIVLSISLWQIISRVSKLFQKVFEHYDALNESVQENVTGIRVVKAFVREKYENEKFAEAAGGLYKLYVKAESLMALNHPIMNLVVYGCIIALSWWGAHFIVGGTLTTGELTSLFTYVMSILSALMMLSMIFVMLTQSAASAKRVTEVINEKPDISNPENPVMKVEDGSVEFRCVRFDYVNKLCSDLDEIYSDIEKTSQDAEKVVLNAEGTASDSVATNTKGTSQGADESSSNADSPASQQSELTCPADEPEPMVSADGQQHKRSALYNVSFKIAPGETIGVIGGTGSGKSTLVSLISRLYDVRCGEVLVGGRNVKEYDLTALRSAVSVVLQQNTLFSGSILDNLRWGNENATLEECREACRMAQADDFIMQMPDQYETKIEQGGTNVSGGQKQRLCIARALLRHPQILILDDSTSACDTATDRKIQTAFRTQLPGVTKLIIAQRISTVEHCDKILVMEGGRVTGFDTHEHLRQQNQLYREICEIQNECSGDFDAKT
ncbi:MAG: ABC transporter ATP-binding protein/permease [Prevotella sp.]|nr:ABC transporter ATP-binding protein/permease [Prevotella sp.]